MIYCIGEQKRYEARLGSSRPLLKAGRGLRKGSWYEGGSVWRTEEEARAYLLKSGIDGRAVYGVVADWETDTVQVRGETFRRLLKTAPIVRLGDAGPGETPLEQGVS